MQGLPSLPLSTFRFVQGCRSAFVPRHGPPAPCQAEIFSSSQQFIHFVQAKRKSASSKKLFFSSQRAPGSQHRRHQPNDRSIARLAEDSPVSNEEITLDVQRVACSRNRAPEAPLRHARPLLSDKLATPSSMPRDVKWRQTL